MMPRSGRRHHAWAVWSRDAIPRRQGACSRDQGTRRQLQSWQQDICGRSVSESGAATACVHNKHEAWCACASSAHCASSALDQLWPPIVRPLVVLAAVLPSTYVMHAGCQCPHVASSPTCVGGVLLPTLVVVARRCTHSHCAPSPPLPSVVLRVLRMPCGPTALMSVR